jgi:hypothetical protein
MPFKSYAEQLIEVQAAITAVMSGQEYEIADRRLKRADLDTLFKMQKYLMPLASREQSGKSRLVQVIPRG